MVDHHYTISELERVSGIPRRNIHFYVQQGVIPSPEGAGSAAYYTEEHLLRLKLVLRMRDSHLKLSGIREALDAMSLDEMRSLLEAPEQEWCTWDAESLKTWLYGAEEPTKAKDDQPGTGDSLPAGILFQMGPEKTTSESTQATPARTVATITRTPLRQESVWRRFTIMDGMELHVRSDLLKRYRSAIKGWVNVLREKLG